MRCFLKESNLKIKKIAVVHGEENQSLAFANHLQHEGFPTIVAHPVEMIRIEAD
jgi:metallo-beta-lactamase family protein